MLRITAWRCAKRVSQTIVGDAQFTLPNKHPFNADGEGTPYAMRTWGAVFLEIGVDPDFGILRLRRVVGSYSAGRIINPKTARSQLTGGIIWEWGKATMEESVQEPHARSLARQESFQRRDSCECRHSDEIDVTFVEEFDPHASTLGARGIGELAATGVARRRCERGLRRSRRQSEIVTDLAVENLEGIAAT